MRLSPLTSLPPEVTLRIFKHAEDFATVSALVRTASIFHCLWLLNANSIAVAVLPKAVVCYPEAQCLVQAQELKEPTASTPEGQRQSHRGEIIVLVRRYLTNARLVCGFYERNVHPVLADVREKKLDITKWPLLERSRFIRTLYHLQTLAVIHEYSDASCPVLSHIGQQELIDLSELASWFRRVSTAERRMELGVETLLRDTRWLQKWMDIRWAAMRNRRLPS
ncbi:MAG: hypothetical protein L6R38_000574 [Xanthoria sp. 2 TBL-2021]|nr:MAG: hypothetical protein L6R38_000574 [Xanthoria sp. 2 TBL-2021]